jgi:outer membrane protein OmpA-like peptidoglycan-associated protein
MIKRAVLLGAVAVLAVACAKFPVVRPVVQPVVPPPARSDFYVLLPQAGAVGALVVTSEGREQTLNRPYAAAKIGQPGTIETATTTEAEVRDAFGAALTAQPPRPVSFLLYFQLGSDELTPESQQVVGDIVGEIARRPAPEVLVIGHTDTMGTDAYNDRLSVQRAERIRARLLERGLGIAASGVFASGRGKRELLVPTADQVAEPKNRRVELVVR